MDSEKKDSSGYLDGVPFRIGSKFCPPRNVQLPFACAPLFPLDLLEEEYDFSLEKEVLKSSTNDVLQEETIPKTMDGNGTSEASSQLSPLKAENSEQLGNLNPNPGATNFSAPSWQSSSILQPQSLSHSKTSENGPLSPTKNSSKNINLSDFENDTSSPFDYMELQTINDLEELSNVFQGLNVNKPKTFTEGDKSCVYSSCNTSLPSLNSETKEQTLTNFSKSVSFPMHQESRFLISDSHSSTNTPSCDLSNVSTVNMDSRNMNGSSQLSCSFPGISSLPNFYQEVGEQQHAGNSVVFRGKDSVSFSALSQVPPAASFSSTTTVGHMNSHTQGLSSSHQGKAGGVLRSSKSVSDLHSLPQLEDSSSFPTSVRSHTPPPSIANQVLDNEKSLKKDLSHENDSGSSASLPDPYFELEETERQFVDSVTDMGFPRDQVARTVKHLGTDDKKVVEHLCQIQTLEESGYDSLEAEAALHLHDYNSDEARKYLDLLIKIQSLGFDKTAIKKALVQNKNDMNGAINSLLS